MAAALARKGLIILDRDGVVNRDSDQFIKSAAEWIPIPGSVEAIAMLCDAGYTVAIASNQSGLARGLFDRSALRSMHRRLRKLVAEKGGRVARIVVCPHGPGDDCSCRKPKPGLLHRLARYFDTELKGVPVVGDSLRDLQAAACAGARPILVLTGKGKKTADNLPADLKSVERFDDLAAAARQLAKE